MKITIAQLNSTVGDFQGNLEKIKKAVCQAEKEKSDLVIFPELFVTGYPPRDLLERKEFIKRADKVSQEVAKFSRRHPNIGILFGNITLRKEKIGNRIYNSAVLAYRGKIIFRQHKTCLPKRDVFDEPRYFEPAQEIKLCSFKGEKLGISICADIWAGLKWMEQEYPSTPIEDLAEKGATLFINLSASPFYAGKEKIRFRILKDQTKKYKIPIIYVNQIGGNDELIFDGRSMAVNKKGESVKILPSFEEAIETIDISKFNEFINFKPEEEIDTIYRALILGVRDYLKKCGFEKAVLGLSGGIDSSVTAAVACAALGKENILGLGMPSPYSSEASITNAQKLANNLGIKFEIIPITPIYQDYVNSLEKYLGKEITVAHENIQARIRGNILMALSNKQGHIVLSTGNKSELAVGYCTLYGDMTGGLSVLSDLPKNKVYELARYINKKREIIPREVLRKKPSPELRPGQLTENDLISYDILDPIIDLYVEEKLSVKEIIKKGFNIKDVEWAVKRINRNEFKRRQSAPGLKVTDKAFGMGRRIPVAAKYNF